MSKNPVLFETNAILFPSDDQTGEKSPEILLVNLNLLEPSELTVYISTLLSPISSEEIYTILWIFSDSEFGDNEEFVLQENAININNPLIIFNIY